MIVLSDFRQLFGLARPVNLLIAALTFAFSAYISHLFSFTFVEEWVFWVEMSLIVTIMAGGYWINDVADLSIDRINKPHLVRVSIYISAKKVMTAYFVANAFVLLGSLLLPPKFQLLNLSAVLVLYVYAQRFKRQAVIGNLLIAALSAAVVLAGGLTAHLKMAHLWGIILSFQLTFVREISKDVEDLRGDLQHGLQTLPILVGIRQSRRVIWVALGVLLLSCNLPLLVHWLVFDVVLRFYIGISMVLVQLPLLMAVKKLGRSRRPSDFGELSQMLKFIMVMGLLSLLAIR